jgi:hypothetical protein
MVETGIIYLWVHGYVFCTCLPDEYDILSITYLPGKESNLYISLYWVKLTDLQVSSNIDHWHL